MILAISGCQVRECSAPFDVYLKDGILVSENQAIEIEDLNVSGMTKNHKLALALSDVGFSEFRRQIEYKAQLYNTTVVLADRFYPSSKTCSVCDYVLPKLELKTRE